MLDPRRPDAKTRRRYLLFDLDGTIIDPAPGIIGSVRETLRELGAEVPDVGELRFVIGPPLRASFERLLGGTERVEQAVSLYRDRYGAGAMLDASPYDGIAEALRALGQRYALLVATSKPYVFAKPILCHFKLERLFTAIHGAELDGRRDDKGELIGHLLESEGLEPRQTLMVGDRSYDVLGAARHGISTIGVLWGHGSKAELEAAGAAALCQRPNELIGWVDAHLKLERLD